MAAPVSGSPSRALRAAWIPVDLALFAAFMAQAALLLSQEGEDCFISYRYARNLVRGDGLVYNPGEYVEGFSNPLWTVSLAAGHWLGLPFNAAVFLMILACSAATFAALWWACRRYFGEASLVSRIPLAFLACMTMLPASCGNRLEGGAVCLSLALLLAGMMLRRPAWLAAGSVLIILNRPEGVAVAGLAGLWMAWQVKSGTITGRAFRTWLAVVGGVFAAITLFRCAYYGDFLPNTLRAKRIVTDPDLLKNGGGVYVLGYARYVGWPLLALAAASVLCPRRRDLAVAGMALVIFNTVMALLNGGDWMVHYRLLTPYFPVIAVLAAFVPALVAGWSRMLGVLAAAVCLALAARLVMPQELRQVIPQFANLPRVALMDETERFPGFDRNIPVKTLAEKDDLVVLESGGGPAYALDGVRVLELNGLTDRDLTRLDNPHAFRRPATGTLNWPAIFRKEPTCLIFNACSTFYYINSIADIPELNPMLDRYVLVQNHPIGANNSFANVMLIRRDRKSTTLFLQEYGAFAPPRDYVNERLATQYVISTTDPATGSLIDTPFRSPWDLAPWRDGAGTEHTGAWRDWAGSPRYCIEVAVGPQPLRMVKDLPDVTPLVLAMGMVSGPVAEVTLLWRDATGSVLHQARTALTEKGAFHRWFSGLAVQTAGPLTLEVSADQPGTLLLAACRWPGALPALPEMAVLPAPSLAR